MTKQQQIGNKSELAVLSRFVSEGYTVSLPYSGSARYDFIAESEYGKLYKVQVKHGRVKTVHGRDYIKFNTASWAGSTEKTRNYVGECDFIAVWCSELNRMFVIPCTAEYNNKREMTLLLDDGDPVQYAKVKSHKASTFEIFK